MTWVTFFFMSSRNLRMNSDFFRINSFLLKKNWLTRNCFCFRFIFLIGIFCLYIYKVYCLNIFKVRHLLLIKVWNPENLKLKSEGCFFIFIRRWQQNFCHTLNRAGLLLFLIIVIIRIFSVTDSNQVSFLLW